MAHISHKVRGVAVSRLKGLLTSLVKVHDLGKDSKRGTYDGFLDAWSELWLQKFTQRTWQYELLQ